jgi:hypothetical protein
MIEVFDHRGSALPRARWTGLRPTAGLAGLTAPPPCDPRPALQSGAASSPRPSQRLLQFSQFSQFSQLIALKPQLLSCSPGSRVDRFCSNMCKHPSLGLIGQYLLLPMSMLR